MESRRFFCCGSHDSTFSFLGSAMPYNFVCFAVKTQNVLAAKRTGFNQMELFFAFKWDFKYFEIFEIFEYLVCFQELS